MAQFKISILLIAVILTLKSSQVSAQNGCLQQDTVFLQSNDFKILVNDKYYLDIEITQENKIKEMAKIMKPILMHQIHYAVIAEKPAEARPAFTLFLETCKTLNL